MLELGDEGLGGGAVDRDDVVGLGDGAHAVGGERQRKRDRKEETCDFGQCVGLVV
jgi:hypothetical protein